MTAKRAEQLTPAQRFRLELEAHLPRLPVEELEVLRALAEAELISREEDTYVPRAEPDLATAVR